MADKLPPDMLGDRSDRLKEMRDLLADLPRRLADVLQQNAQREGNTIAGGRGGAADSTGGGGKTPTGTAASLPGSLPTGDFREAVSGAKGKEGEESALSKYGGKAPWETALGGLGGAIISDLKSWWGGKEKEGSTQLPGAPGGSGKSPTMPAAGEPKADARLGRYFEERMQAPLVAKPLAPLPKAREVPDSPLFIGARPEEIPEAKVLPEQVPQEFIVAPPKPPPIGSMPLPSLFAGPRPGQAPMLPPLDPFRNEPWKNDPTASETMQAKREREQAALAPLPGTPPFKPTMPPLAEDHPKFKAEQEAIKIPSLGTAFDSFRERKEAEALKLAATPYPSSDDPRAGDYRREKPPSLSSAGAPPVTSIPGSQVPAMTPAGGGAVGAVGELGDLIEVGEATNEKLDKLTAAVERQSKAGGKEIAPASASILGREKKPARESVGTAVTTSRFGVTEAARALVTSGQARP